jgi:TetR/AcrR family fatty acid metabolism transcriptional regulator
MNESSFSLEGASGMARPRSENIRERILQAATRVFAREGYFQARVSEIARRARVADGTIYLYFRNKEHILTSLFDEIMAEHVEAARREVEGVDDAGAALRAIAEHHLGLLGGNRDLAVVFQVEFRQSTQFMDRFTRTWFGTYLDLLSEVIGRGQQAGAIRDDLPPRLIARAFFGALDEMVTSWILSRRRDALREMAVPVVELFLGGAAASTGRGRRRPALQTASSSGGR